MFWTSKKASVAAARQMLFIFLSIFRNGIGAMLSHHFLQGLEIPKGFGALIRVAEQRRGMEHSHAPGTVDFEPFSVLPGDAEFWVDELHGGNSTQTYNELGPEQFDLRIEPGTAAFPFCGLWIAVLGRAAFDDVGDVAVPAAKADDGQNLV